MRRSYWAWLMASMLLAGCASTFDFRRAQVFEDIARKYENLIIWSEFGSARQFLATDDPTTRSVPPRNVRVTNYRVRQVAQSEDARKIVQVVEITYYKADNVQLKTIMDEQLWEFDAGKGVWLLKSGYPNFE